MAEQRVQRRRAAILAADVVGYSQLMGDDEAGTLARLKTLRAEVIEPSLARYGGRMVKVMGDGVLVEFASAVDAVQSALDVQAAMAGRNDGVAEAGRMVFRVGINVGDVIVEDDDIHGDGVNIAARLEGLSEPGGICISDDVLRQVRGKLDATCAKFACRVSSGHGRGTKLAPAVGPDSTWNVEELLSVGNAKAVVTTEMLLDQSRFRPSTSSS